MILLRANFCREQLQQTKRYLRHGDASQKDSEVVKFSGRSRGSRRGLPRHHLPTLRAFDLHIGVAAVEQLGVAVNENIHLHVAGHHNRLAVDLDVLDRALDLLVFEYALLHSAMYSARVSACPLEWVWLFLQQL